MKLEPHKLSREQTATPDLALDAQYTTIFRSKTCAALWGCQTRQDELCHVTSLQQHLQKPTMQHLMEINNIIRRLQRPQSERSLPFGLYYRRLYPPLRVVTVSDASSANKKSNFATEGTAALIMEDRLGKPRCDKGDFLAEEDIHLVGGAGHLLIGLSQKSKRVPHSTSHAETLSAAKCIPVGQFVCMRLAEPDIAIRFNRPPTPMALLQIQDSSECPVCHDHFIDCMDLWELACGLRGIPQDNSQRLGVLAIREERRSLRLRRFYHVRTHWMLVDQLTKYDGCVSASVMEILSSGYWTIAGTLRVRHHFGKEQPTPEPTQIAEQIAAKYSCGE